MVSIQSVTEEKEMPKSEKTAKPKFQMVNRDDTGEKTDDEGKVVINIFLREGSHAKKGNLIKSITIKDARVSDVYEHVKASFGG